MKINSVIYFITGIIVLGGLFFMLKPKESQIPQNTTQESSLSPSPKMESKIFELVVKDKKIVSGSEIITVTQRDEVVISVTADEDEEFHVHGYDVSLDLEKDIKGELKFTASLSGRFPFELEQSKTELGALEVQPN